MANDIAIQCEGVTKTYGKGEAAVEALRGVDLEVRTGEMMMLVGPSGCGKTTFLSVVAGILSHDEGDCLVFGNDWKEMRSGKIVGYRGKNIGFVFQSYNLIPTLSAAENVAIPLLVNGASLDDAQKRARELLERMGIGEKAEVRPGELSGGQQQRVALARGLANDPKLMVCDEPTSSLDGETGRQILEALRDVGLGGERTLLVVTHDNRIFEFADRIARMEDGRIKEVVQSPEELEESVTGARSESGDGSENTQQDSRSPSPSDGST